MSHMGGPLHLYPTVNDSNLEKSKRIFRKVMVKSCNLKLHAGVFLCIKSAEHGGLVALWVARKCRRLRTSVYKRNPPILARKYCPEMTAGFINTSPPPSPDLLVLTVLRQNCSCAPLSASAGFLSGWNCPEANAFLFTRENRRSRNRFLPVRVAGLVMTLLLLLFLV